MARNSSFAYKGKAVNAQQVGRELGVRYLLEGSVQRADNRIRISAQLIDAATGNHLWAERYVRQATDLFVVQDEILQRIVTALKVNLTMDEVARVRLKTTDNVAAWNHYLRGQKLFRQSRSAEMQLARVEYGKALILDPDFEAALLGLGWSYLWEDRYGTGFGAPDPGLLDRAAALAGRTMALNDTLAEPYALLGLVYLSKRQHGEAVGYARQAVTAEPSGAEWRMQLASNLSYAGKLEEALAEIGKAMELNPFPTDELLSTAARIYYQAGQYGQAIRIAKGLTERRRKIERSPIWVESHLFLIAAYSATGRLEEARAAAVEYNQRRRMKWPPKPKIYILYFMRFKEQAEIDRLLADLAKAGLPE
ncbi:MAG: hypothetical protein IIA40_08260 [SAR324 cluster bacterium]|nr:hypothetical protein [SAR324 cluster bacterium]